MGQLYRQLKMFEGERTTTDEMRKFCQRPGKRDEEGNLVYYTEQAHKDTCDVNKIIKKYDKTGLINHVSRMEAKYGDMTGLDYKEALDKVKGAEKMFLELPSAIRKRFEQSPQKFLAFMADGKNRDEAIALGIIDPRWTPETDGLGEHIKSDLERKIEKDEENA